MKAGVIQSLKEQLIRRRGEAGVFTALPVLDELLGTGGLNRGAIHEVISAVPQGQSRSFALLLARVGLGARAIAWCVEQRASERWYPPAAAMVGIPADRLITLCTANARETLWAVAECLRCKGVGVTIASINGKLGSIDARRLQLAAEQGGGIGILLRDATAKSMHYAAATRWLIESQPGKPDVQRWRITLLHGQGGQIERSIGLEISRETHLVRAFEELADQPAQTKKTRTAG